VRSIVGVPLVLALWVSSVSAKEPPSVTARLEPDRLRAGEIATLRIEFHGGFGPRTAPALPLTNLEIVAGPSIENRFEWINGRTSSATVLLYRLRALTPGPAAVAPVRFTDASGVSLETPALSATVEKGEGEEASGAPSARGDPALVSRLEPSSPYEWQQAVWTLYLVTRGEPTQAEVRALPDFRGFWAEDLDRESNVTPRIWTLGGVAWRAYPLARKALFPSRSGPLTIGPAKAVASLRPDIFDAFGNFPFGETQSVERSSTPLTATCRPVPGGRAGLPVGSFSLKASLDRKEIAAGESATLTAVLSGDGRLNDLPVPALSIAGARVSEPETRLTWKRSGGRLASSRQWQWVLTPERAGRMEIAQIRAEVFDPASAAVRRVESAALSLTALAPPAPEPPPAAAPGKPPAGAREGRPATGMATAAGAFAALALLAIGFLMGRRRHDRALAAETAPRHGTAEDRVAAVLARIASDGRLDRKPGARDELRRLAGRLDEIRFGPQLSSREEGARRLEDDVLRFARALRIRV
jgi:hypothetical protein